ncbi:hypothetical protein DYD21_00690 [Rhodohalobacter sp. SW132]|uniref:diacylglycerol/lipid kinase family protein n=1 Tax=Rhodohalobacter sp. SW132 TaxID=2293433 RepID=UPI000E248AD9|nr:diacylglycerol kinase family protein [Rhodohalobacter sp. SW132]REL38498.1 hypothetical protein DYD21_00690 [Rhodohalobacter sp. SW132]
MTTHQPGICFVFNPSANGGKAEKMREEIRDKTKRLWPHRTWMETEPDPQFWVHLAEQAKNFDLMVACGGDGTVHKTGSIAADTGTTLGVIPLGSGNDFAMMNNIPESPADALNLIAANHLTKIDLIRCSGDVNGWCLNTAGIGLDGLANVYTNEFKKTVGRLGYVLGALKAIFKTSACEVVIRADNNEPEKKLLMMITACAGKREGGAFIVAPDADNRDGKLDLLTVSKMNKLKLLIALPQFLFRFPENMKEIRHEQFQKVELHTAIPLHIHIDGELAGTKISDLKFEVHKHALQIISGPIV